MKRTALLLAVMAAALVVASGVALAATYVGTNKGETIVGTGYADTIDAKDGDDVVRGLGGQRHDTRRGRHRQAIWRLRRRYHQNPGRLQGLRRLRRRRRHGLRRPQGPGCKLREADIGGAP